MSRAFAANTFGEIMAAQRDVTTRNIIVLGLSQHGKTTFMNGMLAFQGGCRDGDGRVGNGTTRCTEFPSIYNFHEPGQPTMVLGYQRLPHSKASDVGDDVVLLDTARRDYWKSLKKNSDFEANIHKQGPCVLGRNLIDGANVGKRFRNPFRFRLRKSLRRRAGDASDSEDDLPLPIWCYASQLDANPYVAPAAAAPANDEPAQPIAIRALDTPGIEDSKGQDDEHIERVIDMVLEMETLSGLVMVTKCGCPITPAWKSQVSRYWRLFPMMQSQWIFVHTCADPYAKHNLQRRTESSFESASMERIGVVNEAMRELTGVEDFDAAHIFVESDVEDEECLAAYLAEQHNALFTLVCNFSPVQIQTLSFTKGPALLAIDARVSSALMSTIDAVTATLLEMDEDLGKLLELRNFNAEERASLENELQMTAIQLDEVNHEGMIDVVRYVSKSWGLFRYPSSSVELTTKHANFEISVIDTSGYETTYLEKVSTEILQQHDDGRQRLKICVRVPYLFTSLAGKVVAGSKSCDVNSSKIQTLKVKKAELESALYVMKQGHATAEEMLAAKTENAGQADRRHKTAQAVKQFVKSPWPMSVWKTMKPFYDEFKGQADIDDRMLLARFQFWWMHFIAQSRAELDFEPIDITKGQPPVIS